MEELKANLLFFSLNENSKLEEREIETGEPAESDYSTVEIVSGITLTTTQSGTHTDKNACIVINTEDDNDKEYKLYYLKDENTLYVIELEGISKNPKASDLETKAKSIITALEGNNARHYNYNEDKYALSTI